MTEMLHTPANQTPEEGAIVFIDDPYATGFTDAEVALILTGQAIPGPAVDVIQAAAEIHTGAMIAFIPRPEDAERLALGDGEPVEQLHCTSIYLGDAVDFDDDRRGDIIAQLTEVSHALGPIVANVFGVAILNPAGDEPCFVYTVGGQDISDAQELVEEMSDDGDWASDEQHRPWLAHVTGGYDSTPRRWMTDETFAKLGPIIFDRIRVAFGGVNTDIPLGDEDALAAAAFHMLGKHDQSTHGRGGLVAHSKSQEHGMGARLNGGGSLDPSDPAQAQMITGIQAWTHNTPDHAPFSAEVRDAMEHPNLDTPGASFTRMVASAEPGSPELFRGTSVKSMSEIPDVGHEYSVGPTSFTRNYHIANGNYAVPSGGGDAALVRVHLKEGSRSVRIDQHQGHESWLEEHVTMGRFRVTGRQQGEPKKKVVGKDLVEFPVIDIFIEQIG